MADAPGKQEESTQGRFFARRGPLVGLIAIAVVIVIVFLTVWDFEIDRSSRDIDPPDVAGIPAAPPAIPTTKNKREDLPPAIQRYLESTVYPPGTGLLAEGQNDLLHPNERYEDFRRVIDTFGMDQNDIVSIRLTADRYFYTEDQTVHLTLHARQGAAPIDPVSVQASAIREGRGGNEGEPTLIRFHPHDGGLVPHDGGLVAEIDTDRFADHHGPIVVNARIEYQPAKFHDETLRFFFTPPGKIPARFTGEVRDRLATGSLQIDVGINVEQSGYYRLDANLYGPRGNPLSFSAFKGELQNGERFVPIVFFGRALRDLAAVGPFSVGEIRGYRFLDGEFPDRERIPDLAGRFVTAAYENDLFSPDEFTSEHKERMVQLLLEDVANGISIDAPMQAISGSPASGVQ